MLATPGIPGMQDQSQEGFWATMHGSPQVSSPPPAHHLRSVLPDFTRLTAACCCCMGGPGSGCSQQNPAQLIRKPHPPDCLIHQGLVGTGGKKPWRGLCMLCPTWEASSCFHLTNIMGTRWTSLGLIRDTQAKLKPHLP